MIIASRPYTEPPLGGEKDRNHFSNHLTNSADSNGVYRVSDLAHADALIEHQAEYGGGSSNGSGGGGVMHEQQQLQQELLQMKQRHEVQKRMLMEQFQHQQKELELQQEKQLQEHIQLQKERERQQRQLEEQQRLEREKIEKQRSLKSQRAEGSANASTEVKQRVKQFVLQKQQREGLNHSSSQLYKQWPHQSSLDQSSPPQTGGGLNPQQFQTPMFGQYDHNFPLRKTASDSNLKVRSRIREKCERRSSPLLPRKEGPQHFLLKRKPLTIDTTPYSAPGSGPSSPNGHSHSDSNASSQQQGTEDGIVGYPLLPKKMLSNEISLYTSPSLPNISLGLPPSAASSHPPIGGTNTMSTGNLNSMPPRSTPFIPPGYLMTLPPGGPELSSLLMANPAAFLQSPQAALLEQPAMAAAMAAAAASGASINHPLLAHGLHPFTGLPLTDSPSSVSSALQARLRGPHRHLTRTHSAPPLPANTNIQQLLHYHQQQQQQQQQAIQEQMNLHNLMTNHMRNQLHPEDNMAESPDEAEEEEEAAAAASNSTLTEPPPEELGRPGPLRPSTSITGKPPPPNLIYQARQVREVREVREEEEEQDLQRDEPCSPSPPLTSSLALKVAPNHRQLARTQSAPTAAAFPGLATTNAFETAGARVDQTTAAAAHTFATGLAYDSLMLKHQCRCGNNSLHPEHAGRLQSIWARLQERGVIDRCVKIKGRKASIEELQSCHKEEYSLYYGTNQLNTHHKKFTDLQNPNFTVLPCGGLGVDSDTVWNDHHTSTAARMAVGFVVDLALQVGTGKLKNGFAVVRPPGHHAEPNQAMGFCYFNNVAIAAKQLRQRLGLEKVLIVDWDVHHGNSTQKIFYTDPHVLYISLHRHDDGNFFPGTGAPEECGAEAGLGFNVNIAWHGGLEPPMGDSEYMVAFRTIVMPIAQEFNPDIVLVSAGFDACTGHPSPLGGYQVSPACFGYLTRQLMTLAEGRVVLALEGGYDLAAICDASEICAYSLLGDSIGPLSEKSIKKLPNKNAVACLEKTIDIQSKFWPILHKHTNSVGSSLYSAQLCEKEADTVNALASLSMAGQRGDSAGSEPMDEEPPVSLIDVDRT